MNQEENDNQPAEQWQPSDGNTPQVAEEEQRDDWYECDECHKKSEDRYFTTRHPQGVCPRCFTAGWYRCNGCLSLLEEAVTPSVKTRTKTFCQGCAAEDPAAVQEADETQRGGQSAMADTAGDGDEES